MAKLTWGLAWAFLAEARAEPAARKPVGAVPPRATTACAQAEAAWEAYLAGLPRRCARDKDCESFPWRLDPCAPAVILSRDAEYATQDPAWAAKREAVRAACPASRAMCAPRPSRPACNRKTCIDAEHP